MKAVKNLLILIIFFFSTTTAFAQYYNTYNHGRGSNPGVDRSIARQRNSNIKKNKDKKAQQVDIVEVTVKQLDKELQLDDFQKAALSVIYNENKDELMSLVEEDIPHEAKKQKAKEITEKIDKEIFKLLSPEQAAKYQKLVDKRKF